MSTRDLDLGDNDPRAYMQIARRVTSQIQDGTLALGSPAPSITVLALETGHARPTCGKALRRLEDEGLLTRYPGLGYFVTSQPGTAHADSAAATASSPAARTAARPRPAPAPRQVTQPARHARGTRSGDPDQLPQAIFRPPGHAPQPAVQPPAILPGSPGQGPGEPLENVFEMPGAWAPGEHHLCWLVTAVDERSAAAAEALISRYRELAGGAGLTPVPPRWLHIAVDHAGLASDLTAREQAQLVSIVREQTATLPAFTITIDPPEVTVRGIACRARPQAALRRLQALTADALKSAGHHCPAPPAVLQVPHTVLAYATSDATTGPLHEQLSAIPATGAKIRVAELRLVRASHDGHQITWRPVETIPVGKPPPPSSPPPPAQPGRSATRQTGKQGRQPRQRLPPPAPSAAAIPAEPGDDEPAVRQLAPAPGPRAAQAPGSAPPPDPVTAAGPSLSCPLCPGIIGSCGCGWVREGPVRWTIPDPGHQIVTRLAAPRAAGDTLRSLATGNSGGSSPNSGAPLRLHRQPRRDIPQTAPSVLIQNLCRSS